MFNNELKCLNKPTTSAIILWSMTLHNFFGSKLDLSMQEAAGPLENNSSIKEEELSIPNVVLYLKLIEWKKQLKH